MPYKGEQFRPASFSEGEPRLSRFGLLWSAVVCCGLLRSAVVSWNGTSFLLSALSFPEKD